MSDNTCIYGEGHESMLQVIRIFVLNPEWEKGVGKREMREGVYMFRGQVAVRPLSPCFILASKVY